jgi:HipA-like protein
MPVHARRLIRKMRGGAQAHLIEAADDHYYVVKFLNNPQHRRILVNEWIAAVFLNYLGISSPQVAMIEVSEQFLRDNPDASIQLGNRRQELAAGWHFGSRFPGDPARQIVYDFLPDALIETVENLLEFLGVLAFDKWVSNADSRQAVFFRANLKELPRSGSPSAPRVGFAAQMVDNGYVFEGPHWRLTDSPLQGLYFRPVVYRGVRGLDSFQPWLDRILHFPEEIVDQAVRQVPPPWLEGEEAALDQLLAQLMRRRKRVPDLIEESRRGRTNPFPDWP